MPRHDSGRNRTSRLPRRRSRLQDNGWSFEAISAAPHGPEIRSASVEEALAAIQRFSGDLPWAEVEPHVIPLFQRLRPYAPGFPDSVRMVVPPGVSVTFGVDTGPAFVHITAELVERWAVTLEEVCQRALANLRDRASGITPAQLLRDPIGDVALQTLQSGTGSASTLVLVPDMLAAIFGPAPQLFIAPMRDLLVSMPVDVEREFAAWLHREYAAIDPNCLAPIAFRYTAGTVTLEPLGDPAAVA